MNSIGGGPCHFLNMEFCFNGFAGLLQETYPDGLIPPEVHPWFSLACSIYKKPEPGISRHMPPLRRARTIPIDTDDYKSIHAMEDYTNKGTRCCYVCGTTEERLRKLEQKGQYMPDCMVDYKIYNRFIIFKQSLIDYLVLTKQQTPICKGVHARPNIIDVKCISKHLLLPVPLCQQDKVLSTYIKMRNAGVTYGFEKETGAIDCIYIGKSRQYGGISLRLPRPNAWDQRPALDIHLGMNGWKGYVHHFHVPCLRGTHGTVTLEPREVRWSDRTYMGRIQDFCIKEQRQSFSKPHYWYDVTANEFILETERPGVDFKTLMLSRWGHNEEVGDRSRVLSILRGEEVTDDAYLFLPRVDSYELGIYIIMSLPEPIRIEGVCVLNPAMVSKVLKTLVTCMGSLSEQAITDTPMVGRALCALREKCRPFLEDLDQYHQSLANYYITWTEEVAKYWATVDRSIVALPVSRLPTGHPIAPCLMEEPNLSPPGRGAGRVYPLSRRRYPRDPQTPITREVKCAADVVKNILYIKRGTSGDPTAEDQYVKTCHNYLKQSKQIVLEKWAAPMTDVRFDHVKFATQGTKGDSEIYLSHLGTPQCPGWSRAVNRGDFIGHVEGKPIAVHGPIKIIGSGLNTREFDHKLPNSPDLFFMKMDGAQGKVKVVRNREGEYIRVLSSKDSPTVSICNRDGQLIPSRDHSRTMVTYCEEDSNINLRKSGYVVRQLHSIFKGKKALDIICNITLHCEVIGVDEKLQIIYNKETCPWRTVFVYGANDNRGNPIPFHIVQRDIAAPLGLGFVRCFPNDGRPYTITSLRNVGMFTLFEGVVARRTYPTYDGETYEDSIRTGSSKEKFPFFLLAHYTRRSLCDASNNKFKLVHFLRGIIGLFDKYVGPTIVIRMAYFATLFIQSYINIVKHETPQEITCLHPHRFRAFHKMMFPHIFHEDYFRVFDVAAPVHEGFNDEQFKAANRIAKWYPHEDHYDYNQHIDYYIHCPRVFGGLKPMPNSYMWISNTIRRKYINRLVRSLRTVSFHEHGWMEIPKGDPIHDDPRLEYDHGRHRVRARGYWTRQSGVVPSSFLESVVLKDKELIYAEDQNNKDLTHIYITDKDPMVKGIYNIIIYSGPALFLPPHTYLVNSIEGSTIKDICSSNYKSLRIRTRGSLPYTEVKNLIDWCG